MKRKGFLFDNITDMDNLRLGFWKAQKGKSAKSDVIEFRRGLDHRLSQISKALSENTYPFGQYHYFTIYDPKRRVICAASFAERVIHHAIMNICAADFENYQIPYSFACRKNKGTFAAVKQAAQYQKQFKWFLKLDMRKYFDSIDHNILFSKIQCVYKDPHLLNLFWQIIDSYHSSDDKGLPIGNLTSQYFANHYLSFADKQAIEKLRIPAYIRYMDDILLWANDRNELMEKGLQLESFIKEHLKLNLKPFVLNRVEHGLPALGFLFFPKTIRLSSRTKKRYISKTGKYTGDLNNNRISETEYAQRFLSAYSFIAHANSKGFARKVLQNGLNAESSNRVNRGGSWNNNATNAAVSNRNNNTPGNSNNNLGFRLACSTKQSFDFEQAFTSFPLHEGKNKASRPVSSNCRKTDGILIKYALHEEK
ncbi:MAG: RNA-directed DNA polymerase [Dysgonamonadaceae bacterium]|jgi:hypothetical protein|nr:RNA-directed DNA polymerase [Dysgonamonadaceae bacterium]